MDAPNKRDYHARSSFADRSEGSSGSCRLCWQSHTTRHRMEGRCAHLCLSVCAHSRAFLCGHVYPGTAKGPGGARLITKPCLPHHMLGMPSIIDTKSCTRLCARNDYWCGRFRANNRFSKAELDLVGYAGNEWTYAGLGTKVRIGKASNPCPNSGGFYCAGSPWRRPAEYGDSGQQMSAVRRAIDNGGLYPGFPAEGRTQCARGTSC